MLTNLRAEMTRYGVTASDIARATGKTDRSIRDKISGKRDLHSPKAPRSATRFSQGCPSNIFLPAHPQAKNQGPAEAEP